MASRRLHTTTPAELSLPPIAKLPDLQGSDWAPGSSNPKRFQTWSARKKPSYQSQPSTSTFSPTVKASLPQLPSAKTPDELEKYDRLIRRLRWKCMHLMVSHQGYELASLDEKLDSSVQFKLDFFEFYSLLERTLVYLLGLFRITVHALDSDHQTYARGSTLLGNVNGPSKHRFHANVLQALAQPGPLHDLLGEREVLHYLTLAKTLRNSWKEEGDRPQRVTVTVAESLKHDGADGSAATRDVPSALVMQNMMESISGGMCGAKALLEAEVANGKSLSDNWEAARKGGYEGFPAYSTSDELSYNDTADDMMEID